MARAHVLAARDGAARWAWLARLGGARVFVLTPIPEARPSAADALRDLAATASALRQALQAAGLRPSPGAPGAWPAAPPSGHRGLGLALLALVPTGWAWLIRPAQGSPAKGILKAWVGWTVGALLAAAGARWAMQGQFFWLGAMPGAPAWWWILSAALVLVVSPLRLVDGMGRVATLLRRPARPVATVLLVAAAGVAFARAVAMAQPALPPLAGLLPAAVRWQPELPLWTWVASYGGADWATWAAAMAAAVAAAAQGWPPALGVPVQAAAMAAVAQVAARPGTTPWVYLTATVAVAVGWAVGTLAVSRPQPPWDEGEVG